MHFQCIACSVKKADLSGFIAFCRLINDQKYFALLYGEAGEYEHFYNTGLLIQDIENKEIIHNDLDTEKSYHYLNEPIYDAGKSKDEDHLYFLSITHKNEEVNHTCPRPFLKAYISFINRDIRIVCVKEASSEYGIEHLNLYENQSLEQFNFKKQ